MEEKILMRAVELIAKKARPLGKNRIYYEAGDGPMADQRLDGIWANIVFKPQSMPLGALRGEKVAVYVTKIEQNYRVLVFTGYTQGS